jgi:hypothetical protein
MPKKVTLKSSASFPIIINGAVSGSLQKPPGTVVKLVSIESDKLNIAFNNYSSSISIDSTDLLELADIQMKKSEKDRAQNDINITQSSATAESHSNQIGNSELSILTNSSIDVEKLSLLIKEHPSEVNQALLNKNIIINGAIAKIYLSGLDHDKVEIVLGQKFQNIYIKETGSDILNQIKINHNDWLSKAFNASYHQYYNYADYINSNQHDLIDDRNVGFKLANGQLLLTVLPNKKNYSRTYSYTSSSGYSSTHTYTTHDSSDIIPLEIPLCIEGDNLPQWKLRLQNGGAHFYFEIVKIE